VGGASLEELMDTVYLLHADHAWNDGKELVSIHATKDGAIAAAKAQESTLVVSFDCEYFTTLTTPESRGTKYEVRPEKVRD
jgi:hypothetical protein